MRVCGEMLHLTVSHKTYWDELREELLRVIDKCKKAKAGPILSATVGAGADPSL